MVDTLKLPEKTRVMLRALYLASQQAQQALHQPLLVACEFLGLDPTLNHYFDFETGIVTPAEALSAPTLIKPEEEAS